MKNKEDEKLEKISKFLDCLAKIFPREFRTERAVQFTKLLFAWFINLGESRVTAIYFQIF